MNLKQIVNGSVAWFACHLYFSCCEGDHGVNKNKEMNKFQWNLAVVLLHFQNPYVDWYDYWQYFKIKLNKHLCSRIRRMDVRFIVSTLDVLHPINHYFINSMFIWFVYDKTVACSTWMLIFEWILTPNLLCTTI